MATADEDPGPAGTEPPVRVLRRSGSDRVIAGVCGGLGGYFGVDPIMFRIAFVILAIAGSGVGIALYIAAWVIMPQGESTPPDPGSRPANASALLVGTIFVALGIGLLIDLVFPWFDRLVWPSLLVALGIYIILESRRPGTK